MTAFRRTRSRRRPAWLLARLMRCAAGVSAVEFALLAPVLVVGAFSTADAGMAVHQRMMIGQALRAGAQRAMEGADEDAIRQALAAVASSNFSVAWDGEPAADTLLLDVESYCGCPDAGFAPVSCLAPCDSGAYPQRFRQLSARTLFSGVLLPDFPISGTVEVLAE